MKRGRDYLRGLFWMLVAFWFIDYGLRLLVELSLTSRYSIDYRLIGVALGLAFRIVLVGFAWVVCFGVSRLVRRGAFLIHCPTLRGFRIAAELSVLLSLAMMRMPSDTVLNRPGIYWVDGSDYRITIFILDNTLVNYVVQDRTGSEVLGSHQSPTFSNAQRWHLCWDSERDWLWVQSSDIGDNVWIKRANGYEKVWIHDQGTTLTSTMPTAFREHLPNSQR